MTSIKSIFTLALIILSLPSCHKGLLGVAGKGNNIEESRTLSGYTSIDLRCDASIDYIQDSINSLRISAQPNILEVLRTTVEDGKLVIDFKKNVRKHNPITITIHAPQINSLLMSGSGNMNARSALTADQLELRISGSGNIWVPQLAVQHLDLKISGSGNIRVSGGTAVSSAYSISGTGNIYAVDVPALVNTSKISGSGNISVQASQELNLSISGSGSLTYKGDPALHSQISGSGKIIHL